MCALHNCTSDETASSHARCILVYPEFQTLWLDSWVLDCIFTPYRKHYVENAVKGANGNKIL